MYLHKRFQEKGIQDYLINRLYTMEDGIVLFFIPEVW
jgi:hypothetical protein